MPFRLVTEPCRSTCPPWNSSITLRAPRGVPRTAGAGPLRIALAPMRGSPIYESSRPPGPWARPLLDLSQRFTSNGTFGTGAQRSERESECCSPHERPPKPNDGSGGDRDAHIPGIGAAASRVDGADDEREDCSRVGRTRRTLSAGDSPTRPRG